MRSLLFLLFVACNPPDDTDEPTDVSDEVPATGTLRLKFEIDEDWRAEMDEPAVGTFYGAVWLADDVTAIGPNEGAVPLADLEVASVDLSVDAVSGVLTEVADLPTGWITVLGFLDSDANQGGTFEPDDRDPVTIPSENEIEVIGGESTEGTVYFGFLNP